MAEEKAAPKKRPNYHRNCPVTATAKRGERLKPLIHALIDENVTIAQLAEKCGMSRQGMNLRFAKDDCNLSDMETMCEVLGYKFEWHITKD